MQFFYPQQPAVGESHLTDRLREEAIREQLRVAHERLMAQFGVGINVTSIQGPSELSPPPTQGRHVGPGMKTWARMFDDDDELVKFARKVANHAQHEGDSEIAKKWRGIYCKMIENKTTITA